MIVYLIVLFAILAGIGCWFLLRRKRRFITLSVSEWKAERPSQTADHQAPKQTPAFLAEMRQKDQSMSVGSPGIENTELDLQSIRQKEKEIMARPRSSKF
jgi:hypothetical protein